MNPLIDLRARTVIWRNHKCAFGRLGILARDGGDALLMPLHFMDSALPAKALDCRANFATRQLLDCLLQLRVALPDNLVQLRRPHTRFLKLRERPARFDSLMLPRIAYQQNAVIWVEAVL